MKAQSAVEYLMTYGWSILIVAVVIASLILLGVFNSGNTGTSSCLATPGYSCANPTLYSSGSLITNIGQVSTQAITITGTACTKNNTVTSITTLSSSVTLQSEGSQQIVFYCPILSSATGTQFTGHLWIEYSTPSQQNIIQEVGAVVTSVVSSNAAAYSPIAYAVNNEGGSGTGNILEINLNTGQVTGAIPSDGTSGAFDHPTGIAISGSTAYVVNEEGGSGFGNILEVNLNTGQITGAIPSDGTSGAFYIPHEIAISGSTAYVVNTNGGSSYTGNILEINLNTGQITGAIPSGDTSGAFHYPIGIAISGSTAYIVNQAGGYGTGNLIEINLNTGQVTGAIPSDGTSGAFDYPIGIAISGSTAYVVNEEGGSSYTGNLIEINLNTGQITGAIPSGDTSGAFHYPIGIAISGSTAYVVNEEGGYGTGNILEINLNTGQITGAIQSDGTSGAFHYPYGIAITQPS